MRVQFPWGLAYMSCDQVAKTPEFTFYALREAQQVKFSLPFALSSPGAEMLAAVRQRLAIPEDAAVSLVQTDSLGRHEIKPESKIGDCTVGTGPRHPVLVLQAPRLRFDAAHCSTLVLLRDRNTVAEQTLPGFGSVLASCQVSRGVKYWEAQLVRSGGGDGVFIGVAATDSLPTGANAMDYDSFWGFSCATGHKLHETIDCFADPCQDGDVVGALLDMDHGRLSFYVNGRYLGVAFCGIRAKRLQPVFSLTSVGQKIKLLPTVAPPLT